MSSEIGDIEANYSKADSLIRSGITKGVDLIVLPEVWTVGWDCSKFRDSAENLSDSKTINFLSQIAKKYGTNVVGGSFITKTESGKYYNTCPFINRNGELVATYDKMHMFSYFGSDEGIYLNAGDNPVMVDIDGIKTGLSVCYDIRFPELFRAYAKKGAELLINAAAWSVKKPIPWEVMTKSRAVENQCYMVALTQSGKLPDGDWNIGHSRIIDFVGNTLCESGVGDSPETSIETTLTAEIKFDKMYEFRKNCTVFKDIQESYEVKEILR